MTLLAEELRNHKPVRPGTSAEIADGKIPPVAASDALKIKIGKLDEPTGILLRIG